MSKSSRILLIPIILVIASATLTIDFPKSIVESNTQWTRIKLAFNSSSQPIQLYYDAYPSGWNQILDYIYIPAQQKMVNRKFPCKFRAKNNQNQQIRSTIIFFSSGEKFFISESLLAYDQTFDDAFFEAGIFQGRPNITNASILESGLNINVDNSNFTAQQQTLNRLAQISEVSGSGIVDLLDVIANDNKTVSLANVQSSIQLKDKLSKNQAKAQISSILEASLIQQNQPTTTNNGQSIIDRTDLTTNQKQLLLISNIRSTELAQTSQQRTIENIFLRLPGPQQLDSIIMTADSLAIVKTIQKVIDSDLKCQEKISYLSDFFGRIQSGISLKSFTATQLAVIIESAQSQISRLTLLIESKRTQIKKLELQIFRKKLNQVLVSLQQAYNRFNDNDVLIFPKKALIIGYDKQIERLKIKADGIRNKIPIQQLQANQYAANVAQLQAKYKEALFNREKISENILKLQTSVASTDQSINYDQKAIDSLDSEIKIISDQVVKTKQSYQALQVFIERQRKQINQREKNQTQISYKIKNLQDNATIEKTKMSTVEYDRLVSFVQSLQIVFPNITTQVDQINYKCHQVKQFEVSKQNNVISYQLAQKQFLVYVESCYRSKPDSTNLKVAKVSITPVSILDDLWVKSYGQSYEQSSFKRAKQFYFNQDFSCFPFDASLESISGTIKKINNKNLQIQSQGRPIRLNLGACSRLQSVQATPRVGQKIYFRGKRKDQRGLQYNLHKGACI